MLNSSYNDRIVSAVGTSIKSIDLVNRAEKDLDAVFKDIDAVETICFSRILNGFSEENIALGHFAPSTGYGYDDIGRDKLEILFAHAMQCEAALVRPQIASGTHAIYLALSGLTEPGDVILSATGMPYDTLENAIGISGNRPNSLRRGGVEFESVELTENGNIDIDSVVRRGLELNPKIIYFQRSRGYAWRDSLLPEKDMSDTFKAIRAAGIKSLIVVDNCYGEFTRPDEPSKFGANVLIGSLIKNPGGGLAPTGGYIAGDAACVEMIAERFTVPGMGREVGSYAGGYRPFFQGLFMAPHTVSQALKSAALFARVFELLGMETIPASDAVRSDIVQAVKFGAPEPLISFCKSIQAASPVDSQASPEPWDMPGYTSQVIMAAGAFVQGSSVELSADAPIREPYIAYVQGSLTYLHGKVALLRVLDKLI